MTEALLDFKILISEYAYKLLRFVRMYLLKKAVNYSTNEYDRSIIKASLKIHYVLSCKTDGEDINVKELVKLIYSNRQNIHDLRRFFYRKYGYCLFSKTREEVSDFQYRLILKNI